MTSSIPYIPGAPPEAAFPLARYLPPAPIGVAASWLEKNLPPGSWILDPFGASPSLVVEAARAGYRVLVAANNPINRFLLEMLANPPRQDELQASLAALSVSRKEDERLEPHILNIYNTECSNCDMAVSADAFLWERDAAAPFARLYECPHCGEGGEEPVTEKDIAAASRFSPTSPTTSLHRARALERVLPLQDQDREHVEEALKVYPPRAVYALFTMINKLDGLPLSDDQKRLLSALLLAAFDRTNTLWPHPSGRARPKQLSVPPRYQENNVWRELESAVESWFWPGMPATFLSFWPDHPPESGGISLHEGRLKSLVASLKGLEIAAILTAIPRPNQAFWTLSALWSGWLWGQEAIGPFRSVLRRRRYDWAWHTGALHAALRSLTPHLSPGTPLFGLLAEAEPGLLAASLVAADMNGIALDGLSLRAREAQAQIHWRSGGTSEALEVGRRDRIEKITRAARGYLQSRGEPCAYLSLQAATLEKQARDGVLVPPALPPGEAYTSVKDDFEETFRDPDEFVRFGGSQHNLNVGGWWLSGEEDTGPPLSDRVETAFVDYLSAHPGRTLPELDRALCQAFPGLLTPETELLYTCLESYGETRPPEEGNWFLGTQETPEARQVDLQEMNDILAQIGQRLDYRVHPGPPLSWETADGEPVALFFIRTSAILGDILLKPRPFLIQSFIVIPGSRANLVAHKLHHDPRLSQAIEGKWRFLKFRLLRRLANNPLLSRDNLAEQFGLDPLTYTSPQMQML